MQIQQNNQLSNHVIKKKLRKIIYTSIEDYDCQTYRYLNNLFRFPSIDNSLKTNQRLIFSGYGNCSNRSTNDFDFYSSLALLTGSDMRSLGNIENLAIRGYHGGTDLAALVVGG